MRARVIEINFRWSPFPKLPGPIHLLLEKLLQRCRVGYMPFADRLEVLTERPAEGVRQTPCESSPRGHADTGDKLGRLARRLARHDAAPNGRRDFPKSLRGHWLAVHIRQGLHHS